MTLTSKQRAELRAMAVELDTILTVGKGGISDTIIVQANEALKVREIIKGKVLKETCPVSPREAAEEISTKTESILVQVIGSKFILYKRNDDEPKIILSKATGKSKK